MSNPKCPYCGEEMKLSMGRDYPIIGRYWYRCDNCDALAPDANSPEEAYAAAMKRDREKGEWIWEENEWQYRCSACCMTFDYDKTYELFDHGYQYANFCPNCGADMRKEANDED